MFDLLNNKPIKVLFEQGCFYGKFFWFQSNRSCYHEIGKEILFVCSTCQFTLLEIKFIIQDNKMSPNL